MGGGRGDGFRGGPNALCTAHFLLNGKSLSVEQSKFEGVYLIVDGLGADLVSFPW